jgi:hypothetical protein
MVVVVGPEIQQLIFQICTRPEQRMIQTFASNGTDEPFHERMGQGNVGDALDFSHLQDPQIGLPLVKLIKRIVVGAEVVWQPALPSNGAVEHSKECDPIDRTGMNAEADDPARVLIHDDQNPVGPQRGRLAAEQIHTPEAVFHVPQQRQPGGPSGARFRQIVMGENPSHHVFVDWDVEGQGDLFSDSRTAPARIPLLQFQDRMDQFCTRSFRAGLAMAVGGEQHTVLLPAHGESRAGLRPSAQGQSGADDWDAPTTPASRQGPGPTPIDSALVGGTDSRSGVGA